MLSCDVQLLPEHTQEALFSTADYVLSVTSFKENVELQVGDYEGTLRILKVPRLHIIAGWQLEFEVWGFRISKGRSGMQIEQIHLEPEEDRTKQDENLE